MLQGDSVEEFWALNDVSFEVKQGEILGIIGRNGAGKSTLLKVLSRITEPTKGRITLRGRVASLLEVGTGFHPELSGRENIFLNGAILGMTRREIKAKFDEIVDFAGVEKFLDTPVKRYSSGMYVRLAFSVAAHLEPEILVVDEVLAVGDAEFQKKCMGKMQDVTSQGRTVLFVSHNMSAIKALCKTGVFLQDGKVLANGEVNEVAAIYHQNKQTKLTNAVIKNEAESGLKITDLFLLDSYENKTNLIDGTKPSAIEILYSITKKLPPFRIVVTLISANEEVIFATSSILTREEENRSIGSYIVRIPLPAYFFNNIEYTIRLNAGIPCQEFLLKSQEVLTFEVSRSYTSETMGTTERWPGLISPKIDWDIQKI